ncbi:MAG: TIGR00730 family Rossman fold protein [Bacteroidales bacterium]|nr:TIGR00730 family Rossman fold protein [Bacteroidales bacterium]
MQYICVYCASSTQIKPAYFETADRLGKILAKEGIHLVYGGGSMGLMGQIADSVLAAGGKVTGIIPRFMCEEEWDHKGLTELIITETMHERKERIAMMADAAVALPGGCGTLEELLEVITWKQLGIFTKPIIIVNVDGYFDSLVAMLHRAVEENFMREVHRDIWKVVETAEEVIPAILNSPKWDKSVRKFAAF